jgi:hypothetical protein
MFRERAARVDRRTFTELYAQQWKPDGPSRRFITIVTVCFARIGWGGTKMDNFECFVTSTGERARAV